MKAGQYAHQTPPTLPEASDLDRLDDKLTAMQQYFNQYGDIYRARSLSRPADTYVINHPDWVRQVLVANHRNYTKGVGIERVRLLLGNGLMTSEGDTWQCQRRQMQPGFQPSAVAGYVPLMQRAAQQTARHWRRQAGRGEAINVTASMSELALSVILQALFSDDLERFTDGQGDNPFALVSAADNRDLQFAVRFRALRKPVATLIEKRRQSNRYPTDLLSFLLQTRDRASGEGMPDKLLIDEVMTLIVAGHETTAASLGWIFYLLAKHPQVAARVAAEAKSLSADTMFTSQTLTALTCTTQVIDETLRLYPPGWLYTRRAVADDQFGPYRLPAGSDVFICAWLLHRHPRYWSEPDRFNPDRFAAGAATERHRFAYLPFSAGPRHCIGEAFAMLELLSTVATLAAQFRFLPVDEQAVELEAEVNLRPKTDIRLQAVPYD